jgi:hypothetical protein
MFVVMTPNVCKATDISLAHKIISINFNLNYVRLITRSSLYLAHIAGHFKDSCVWRQAARRSPPLNFPSVGVQAFQINVLQTILVFSSPCLTMVL